MNKKDVLRGHQPRKTKVGEIRNSGLLESNLELGKSENIFRPTHPSLFREVNKINGASKWVSREYFLTKITTDKKWGRGDGRRA